MGGARALDLQASSFGSHRGCINPRPYPPPISVEGRGREPSCSLETPRGYCGRQRSSTVWTLVERASDIGCFVFTSVSISM